MDNFIAIVVHGISFNVYYDDHGIVDVMIASDSDGMNLCDVLSSDVIGTITSVITKGEGFKK